MSPAFVNNLFSSGKADFFQNAREVFAFQQKENAVYGLFTSVLKRDLSIVHAVTDIPFLPISFFKTHRVVATAFEPEQVFESSGTTKTVQSRHYVKDISVYEASFLNGFQQQYGNPAEWCILGLLPSYLERGQSSLVYMVQKLMEESNHPLNGFYLNDYEQLKKTIVETEAAKQKTLLIGVTFALLDFAEEFQFQTRHLVVMETGGMKGRREELTREEVHQKLKTGFGSSSVHSEYGMTELLSQAYSTGDGIFTCPPWMKVLVREEDDPLTVHTSGKGALNVIDLANIYSCSFIATDDIGEVFEDGSFRVMGRLDNSDIRGCSLLAF